MVLYVIFLLFPCINRERPIICLFEFRKKYILEKKKKQEGFNAHAGFSFFYVINIVFVFVLLLCQALHGRVPVRYNSVLSQLLCAPGVYPYKDYN